MFIRRKRHLSKPEIVESYALQVCSAVKLLQTSAKVGESSVGLEGALRI